MWYLAEPFYAGTGSSLPASLPNAQTATDSAATQQSGWARLDPGTLGGYDGHCAVYFDSARLTNTEIAFKFRFSSVNTDSTLEVFFRSNQNTAFDSQTGYIFQINQTGGVCGWTLANNYSYSSVGSALSFTPSGTTAYRFRGQVVGTTLRAKIWADGTEEPAAWGVTTTDATVANGYVVLHQHGGSAASAYVEIDDLYIGDGTQTPDGAGSGYLRRQAYRRGGATTNAPVWKRSTGQFNIVGVANGSRWGAGPKQLQQRPHAQPFLNPGPAFRSGVMFFPIPDSTDWVQNVEDGAGLVDDAALARDVVLAVEDDAGSTDAATSAREVALASTDGAGAGDASAVALGLGVSDGAGSSDVTATSRTLTATDPASAGDATAVARALVLTDDAGSSDVTATSRALVATDAAGVLDTAVPAVGRALAVEDSAGSTDASALDKGLLLTATDAAGPVDTAALARAIALVATDGAGSSDVTATSRGYGLAAADDAGVSDAADESSSSAGTTVNTAGVSDAFAIERRLAAADDAGVSDAGTALLGGLALSRTGDDAAGVSDVARVSWLPLSFTDAAGALDDGFVSAGRQVDGRDAAGLVDIGGLEQRPAVTDPAGVSDPARVERVLGPVEPAGPVESTTLDRSHHFTDGAGASDDVQVSRGRGLAFTDLGFEFGADQAVIGHGWGVERTDAVEAVDYFPGREIGLGRTDDAGASDRALAEPGRVEPAGVADDVVLERRFGPRDDAGVTDPAAVALNGSLSALDGALAGDTAALARASSASDAAGVSDGAVVLRYTDVSPVDPAGASDPARLDRGLVVEENVASAPERFSLEFGRPLTDAAAPSDTATFRYDRGVTPTDGALGGDTAAFARGSSASDAAGVSDGAAIVVSAVALPVDGAGVTDGVTIALGVRIALIDDAGVREVYAVATNVPRDVTVVGSLAPQQRLVAALGGPGRIAAALGLPPDVVAQMAAQGRVSATLATGPRIVAHLEEQP